MRYSFSPSLFFRSIAAFLVMTMLASGIAMAAYVCPQFTTGALQQKMVEGIACADMDQEQPVHCAQYQSSAELALEQLSAAPAFAPIAVSFIIAAPWPITPIVKHHFLNDDSLNAGADPPYLRTQRLRI